METSDIESSRIRNLQNYIEVTKFFMSETFSSINHLRNLLITLAAIGYAFLQTKIVSFHNFSLISEFLFWSLVVGISSFVCQWKFLLDRSKMYENIAEGFLDVKPPPEKFVASLLNEGTIRSAYPQILYCVSLIMLAIQIILVIGALYFMKSYAPTAISV